MQVRAAFVPAAMLYAAIKQDISEIVVDGCLFIVAGSVAAFKEIIFRGVSRVNLSFIPLHILDNRIAHRDVAVFVVFGVNHVKQLAIKIDILHAKPKGFGYPEAAAILHPQYCRIENMGIHAVRFYLICHGKDV